MPKKFKKKTKQETPQPQTGKPQINKNKTPKNIQEIKILFTLTQSKNVPKEYIGALFTS